MNAELKYRNDWLLVFIDDTGHETFAGTHEYQGLGGCVVLGTHYNWLKGQWREVRRLINGSPDAPLHAADTTWRCARSFAVLSHFFGSLVSANCGHFDTKNSLSRWHALGGASDGRTSRARCWRG